MADDQEPKAKAKTTGRPVDLTGAQVRKNIRRIRDAQGMSAPKLSERLKALGRHINPLGISRIESGDRRVDVDDLAALAVALEVSPISLLMPVSDTPDDLVPTTATGHLPAREVWMWLAGESPLRSQLRTAHWNLAVPGWRVEELKAMQSSDIDWQMQLQNKISALEAQVKVLQARGND